MATPLQAIDVGDAKICEQVLTAVEYVIQEWPKYQNLDIGI